MGEVRPRKGWARWTVAFAAALGLGLLACGADEQAHTEAPSAKTAPAPTRAEAHAAAEKAAGMAPGTLIEDHSYWWSEFMRCSGEMSVITRTARQRYCYGLGAALLTYFDVLRPVWDPEDLAGWELLVVQRMETLGWLDGDEPVFQPLGIGARR